MSTQVQAASRKERVRAYRTRPTRRFESLCRPQVGCME